MKKLSSVSPQVGLFLSVSFLKIQILPIQFFYCIKFWWLTSCCFFTMPIPNSFALLSLFILHKKLKKYLLLLLLVNLIHDFWRFYLQLVNSSYNILHYKLCKDFIACRGILYIFHYITYTMKNYFETTNFSSCKNGFINS